MSQKQVYSMRFKSQIEKEQLQILTELAFNAGSESCWFLEVGSWLGDSTIALGAVVRELGGVLFCVDWWRGSEGTDLRDLANEEDVFSMFWERVCNAGLETTVVPVRGDAKVSLKMFKERSFDFIFIDGDHRYEQARHDIERCKKLVKADGILCGHDCEGYVRDYDKSFLASEMSKDCHESVHCGVVLAVGESFSSYDINHSIWCTQLTDGQWDRLRKPLTCLPYQRQTSPSPLKQFEDGTAYRYGDAVYLIPKSLGQCDVRDEQVRNLPEVVRTRTFEELERRYVVSKGDAPPFLVSPCLHGANIVQYQNKFYIIPCDYGELDLANGDVSEVLREGAVVRSDSYDDSVRIAERMMKEKIAYGGYSQPVLVDQDSDSYGLYFMEGKLYALPIGAREPIDPQAGPLELKSRAYELQASGVLEARKEVESFRMVFKKAKDSCGLMPEGKVHKRNVRAVDPLVSIILLDWECRELFFALDWLNKMDGARDRFEIIWVELYNRVVPEAMEKCDVVMTLDQKGMYHKHKAYNAGLLQARGKIVTVCDSDAVFQPNFIDSILDSFDIPGGLGDPTSKILMHHEYRSPEQYPGNLENMTQLKDYPWVDLWPNVGACLSVSYFDAIRFGGFDEHPSYRGYMCGPYDLGWRMINACIPEIWYDEDKCALWHFAHPDPVGTYMPFSMKLWCEISHPHVNGHALRAVEAFSTGRMLPVQENRNIHAIRMSWRTIGSGFEVPYSEMTGSNGFSWFQRVVFFWELFASTIERGVLRPVYSWIRPRIRIYSWIRPKIRIRLGLGIQTKIKQLLGMDK